MNRETIIALVFCVAVLVSLGILGSISLSFKPVATNTTGTIDVSKGFADDSAQYTSERRALRDAPERKEITVLVGQGGWETSAEPFLQQLKNTKANTTTEITRDFKFGAVSYGAITLMYGKKIKLKNADEVWFHGVYVEAWRMVKTDLTDRHFLPIRSLFTAKEWLKIYDNSHPWITFTGAEICGKLKARVIEKSSTGCTLMGFTQ